MSGDSHSIGGSNPILTLDTKNIKMVGFNTTGKCGGDITQTCASLTARSYKGLSKSFQKMTVVMMCFAIDKGIKSRERQIANCVTAREDRGLSRHEQEGTLICCPILDADKKRIEPTRDVAKEETRIGMANVLDVDHKEGIFIEFSPELKVYAVWYPGRQCYVAIRKLTPKETFRLQSFPDQYYRKAELVNSNSQLYKQSGNSVTVNVIEAIAKKMHEYK